MYHLAYLPHLAVLVDLTGLADLPRLIYHPVMCQYPRVPRFWHPCCERGGEAMRADWG
jgi:hypothetical protein